MEWLSHFFFSFSTTRNRFYIENQDTTVWIYNQSKFWKIAWQEFPSSAVVTIQHFHCWAKVQSLLGEIRILFSHMAQLPSPQKQTKKKKKKPTYLY